MNNTLGLAIRFDGPPSHESGRFVELEIDGKGVGIGEWKDQGNGTWLLVLGPIYAAAPELLEACKLALVEINYDTRHRGKNWAAIEKAIAKAEGKATA